jgi:hypothetical protein
VPDIEVFEVFEVSRFEGKARRRTSRSRVEVPRPGIRGAAKTRGVARMHVPSGDARV